MKKILKKILSYEPLIVWVSYFRTLSFKCILVNFGVPIFICIMLGICAKEKVINSNIDILTISSILIGFCSSIIIMLFTLPDAKAEKLNSINIKETNISLIKALIYKFAYMIYNLIAVIILNLITTSLDFKNIYCILISIGILLNVLLTLIEALSNAVFCLLPR